MFNYNIRDVNKFVFIKLKLTLKVSNYSKWITIEIGILFQFNTPFVELKSILNKGLHPYDDRKIFEKYNAIQTTKIDSVGKNKNILKTAIVTCN